uniref:Uncharacterized protein n=1 Tax=Glossina austeni TaxID=7395 RepID=A0A1A9VWA4_GLOAU
MSTFHEMLLSIINLVGLLATVSFLYDNFKSLFSILKAVLEPYFRPQLPHTLPEKFGKWAENLYQTKVKWILADFSKGKEAYQHIKQELLDIPIGILVNNVGCAYCPDELCTQSEDLLWHIINVNVGAVTLMSRIVIPQMKKQGKGAIVNMASCAELQPMPLWAVYGATKRYVRSLSLAMERELCEHNISVQCVTPAFVSTEIIQFPENFPGKIFATPMETFARSAAFTLVITGGSDGIGKGYAKELAKCGLNVVIISHMREELIATAKEIENLYRTEVKWIVADFSKGKDVYEHIKDELLDIPIGILVNNVGYAASPDKFYNRSEDFLWNIININVGAVTLMSRIVIPQMKKQGKGAIVNIASGLALQPTPLWAVYAATKSYVRSLSLAMERELSEYNVTVQCVIPSFVLTKFIQFSELLSRGFSSSMLAVYEILSSVISLVGLLAAACFLYDNFKSLVSILKAVLGPYFRPHLPHSLPDRFGKWAVITGGSDGIGKGYAKELAKRGLNIVIISRTKEKLIATANEIENLYKTEVKWIVADFSKGKAVYEHIK